MATPTPTALPGASLSSIGAWLADRKLPPVDKWNPDFCGDIDMRIAADGTWFYMGTPIGRPAMVRLFSTILRREPDDRFVLVTPVEKVGIRVDDAPFVAVELIAEGQGSSRTMAFRLNTDDAVVVDDDHPLWVKVDPADETPRPYVHVRAGLNALINRAVFYELVALADAECAAGAPFGLWSAGRFYPLDGSA